MKSVKKFWQQPLKALLIRLLRKCSRPILILNYSGCQKYVPINCHCEESRHGVTTKQSFGNPERLLRFARNDF
jgi:hypothetical protein